MHNCHDHTVHLSDPQTITESSENRITSVGHSHEIEKASQTAAGIVKVVDHTESTDPLEALSANQGRILAEALQEVIHYNKDETINQSLDAALGYLSNRLTASYSTLALAQANAYKHAEASLIYVVNDAEVQNCGLYTIQGGQLVKAPWDALSSALTSEPFEVLHQIMTLPADATVEYQGNVYFSLATLGKAIADGQTEISEIIQTLANANGLLSQYILTDSGQTQEEVNTEIRENYEDVVDELNLKAPQATTYTKAEVDFALDLRAPQSTTYTKAEVDASLTAIAGGHKAYQTLADATAAQVSLSANTVVEVTNDPTSTNNGTYQWNGTTLTKSSYDPLTLAKAYADANPNFKIQQLTASDSLDIRYEGHFNIASDAIATALNAPENKAGVMVVIGSNGTLNRTYRIFNSDKEYFSYSNGASAASPSFAWSAFELKVRNQNVTTAKSEAITDAVNQSTAYTDSTTYQDKGRLTTEHLDTLLTRGVWISNTAANATLANGYPWESVPCVITNKKTSTTPTLLQVAESIESTQKRTATRRHNGTSWGQWNIGEVVSLSQLDLGITNRITTRAEWLFPDDTVLSFNTATRILSWNRTIMCLTSAVTQNRINFSAASLDLSTALDYSVVYLDLTLIPTNGSSVTDPTTCIKVGNYNVFKDDINKIPLVKIRSTTGKAVSCSGFLPVVNSGSGGDGSSTIEFVKTATALEFYVKCGGTNMIKHQLVRSVMPEIQLDNWGMTTAIEVDANKANVKNITSNGVWECALKDSANASDHSGGSHGDELKTSAFFLVDGVYKAEDFVASGKAKEIKFIQKSSIYVEGTTTKCADRQVEWTFTAEKLNMKQTVTPVAGRTFTSTWFLMLPVLRKSNTNNTGSQITDKEIRSNDWTVIDVSEPEFVRRDMIAQDGDQIILSGQASGVSATVKINKMDAPNPMHFIQNNIQFNKIYVAARTINTPALIASGEKWVIDADVVISTIS